jgi:uncharacterized protein (DUF58 family)
MEVADLIKKVRQLELKTKKLSNELFSGNYASTFKGRGISFHGVRAYHYGDDIRSIDWNVTSRSLEPYIKEFEEERELTFVLLVDVSPSVEFGNKRDIINEVAATIAFSALKNNDKVGVLFFHEKIVKYIPPKKGKGHVLTIIRDLIDIPSNTAKTDVGEALRFLQSTIKKKSIVFLLSDFLETAGYERELKLASLRHRFYAIQFYDQMEKQFPNLGIVPLFNAEFKTTQWVDSSSTVFKEYMASKLEETIALQKNMFEKSGGKYCAIACNEAYIPKLSEVFRS